MKADLEYQADYLENLAKDMWAFLVNNKTEKFKIYFGALFFILKYAKDKCLDISSIIDIIYKNNIVFDKIDIIKKEELIEFLKEIFSNYERDDKSWPFNFIKEKEELEGEKEENNKLYDTNQNIYSTVTKDEILFIGIFLGYLSEINGKEEDYKLFFLNEKIKNITAQVFSKIKNIKSEIPIDSNCKKIFMRLFDGKKDILEALQMEKDLFKYFELINEKFNYLKELSEKFSTTLNIESSIIKADEDLNKIIPIYKEIILKEKNHYFFLFKSFIKRSIELFKDSNLNNLICLIEFIENEKKVNYENYYHETIKNLDSNLGKAINDTIKTYINSNQHPGIYYLEIIPKIKKYFGDFSEADKFKILESAKIGKEQQKN